MKGKLIITAIVAVLSIGLTASGQTTLRAVTFKNNAINMAGNLYFPAGMDSTKKYASIVVVHPGGGVKEQTAGLYAKHLAEAGFVALAFDASYQGASGGEPRFLDDPMNRVGDIYSAVDYLVTLPYIDVDRIGAMGICAGSGATVKAAMTERRIKALVTVSGVDVGAASRRGWEGKDTLDQVAVLETIAKQRTAEANGSAPMYGRYVPEVGDTSAPRDLQEAAVYYRTPRGQHPNSTNKVLFTSTSYAILFDGFGQADRLLTQPLLLIAGSEAGSLWQSQELIKKAASKNKELFIVKGATHMDLYDIPKYVDQAVVKMTTFFVKNL